MTDYLAAWTTCLSVTVLHYILQWDQDSHQDNMGERESIKKYFVAILMEYCFKKLQNVISIMRY